MISIAETDIIKTKIPGLKLGLLRASHISVIIDDPHFNQAFAELEQFLINKFSDKRPAEDKIVGHVRRMYRRIGWEPTRYRPSSEALIRRILNNKGLYRINNLVDYGNIVSARYHIPMGLYDLDKVRGSVQVDVGRENESYEGISKADIHARGKMILRDGDGIFGNPTADSLRTSITQATQRALAIFFCPPEVAEEYLKNVLQYLADFYRPFTKGHNCQQSVLIL